MKINFPILYISLPLLIGGLLVSIVTANAQSGSQYALVGSARTGSATGCYDLTRTGGSQIGAVWSPKPLRLTKSFELEFTLNFGDNPRGADGVVMVMQTQGDKALGVGAGGIGFLGLQPSLGVEFDTNQNIELGDPPQDHIAIVSNGISDHRRNTAFAQPVAISSTSNTVKDGRDHLVKVSWTVATRMLQVTVDCVPRINQSVDLINTIFNGVQEVTWGFTAATGGNSNTHTVCVSKEADGDTLSACRFEDLTLVSAVSMDDQYEWKPATGLDNSHSRTPHLRAQTDQLYTVTYLDHCSVPTIDSVFVNVKTPGVSLGDDRDVCENQIVELNPTLEPNNAAVQFQWSTGDTTRQIKPTASGLYVLQIKKDGCSVSDSALVTFHPMPKLGPLTEPTYDCPRGLPILLDPQATGNGLQFIWTPGGATDPILSASAPGRYMVKVSTDFKCTAEQGFTILDNCPPDALVSVPDAFTPNGDGTNEVFEWKSDTTIEARMNIYNRWGELIFSSENPREFWNGTWQGQQCPSNIYTWRLDYRSQQSNQNQWFIKRGKVLLVR